MNRCLHFLAVSIVTVFGVGCNAQQGGTQIRTIQDAGDVAFANHLGDQNTYRDPTTGQTYKVSNQ